MKALKLTPPLFIDNKENVFTYVGSWTPKLNQQSYFEVLRHALIGDAISQSIKQYCCYTLYLFPFHWLRSYTRDTGPVGVPTMRVLWSLG